MGYARNTCHPDEPPKTLETKPNGDKTNGREKSAFFSFSTLPVSLPEFPLIGVPCSIIMFLAFTIGAIPKAKEQAWAGIMTRS